LDIARSIRVTNIKKGQRLFDVGSVGDQFFIIVQGKIGIYYPSKEYTALKEDEKEANQRLICVSPAEAVALRT
jgi:CRP-like cAMP-binding protein